MMCAYYLLCVFFLFGVEGAFRLLRRETIHRDAGLIGDNLEVKDSDSHILTSPIYKTRVSDETLAENIQTNNLDALILTPLIEKGQIEEAQKRSKVSPDILGTQSYTGYLTVNTTCDNNLFFWLILSEETPEDAPLVLWLQGGPGGPSLYGLFFENGPFKIVNGKLEKREVSWYKRTNMLYIDQPVNTGYSYSSKGCYLNTDRQCGVEVYSALVQLLTMFPKLADNKFFISGESYAGHYIPHLAQVIHQNNPTAKVKINLSGLIIGDPWIDSVKNSDYSQQLRDLGLLDTKESKQLDKHYQQFVQAMQTGDLEDGLETFLDFSSNLTVAIENINIYDYLAMNSDLDSDIQSLIEFLNNPSIKKAVHVGNHNFTVDTDKVRDGLKFSYLQSVAGVVEDVMEHYPIIIYVGQLDIICGYPTVANILESLKWSAASKFKDADRQRWCINKQLVGFHRSAGKV